VGVDSGEVDQLLKGYLESKFGLSLDYFAIEGRMTPDPKGDMGVTGSYRKKPSDKKIFFTATVNLEARTVQNLQEY
jgi:hypothetical protein